MKIKLTQGQFTLVDEEDFDYLNQWKWSYNPSGGYAYRNQNNHGIWLHRLLINPPKGFETDHINGDGLDNRRANLRIVTHQQNLMNQKVKSNNKTGYAGVSFERSRKRWFASLYLGGKTIFQKRFKDFNQAIMARKEAEDIYFGKYKRKPVIFTLEE